MSHAALDDNGAWMQTAPPSQPSPLASHPAQSPPSSGSGASLGRARTLALKTTTLRALPAAGAPPSQTGSTGSSVSTPSTVSMTAQPSTKPGTPLERTSPPCERSSSTSSAMLPWCLTVLAVALLAVAAVHETLRPRHYTFEPVTITATASAR